MQDDHCAWGRAVRILGGIESKPASLFVLSFENNQESSGYFFSKIKSWGGGSRSGATNGVEDVRNGRTPHGETL